MKIRWCASAVLYLEFRFMRYVILPIDWSPSCPHFPHVVGAWPEMSPVPGICGEDMIKECCLDFKQQPSQVCVVLFVFLWGNKRTVNNISILAGMTPKLGSRLQSKWLRTSETNGLVLIFRPPAPHLHSCTLWHAHTQTHTTSCCVVVY